MKKLKFFAASLGLMTLAACSNSDEVFNGADQLAQLEQEDNAITFGTYMGQAAQTRAAYEGSMTNALLKSKGFGVFGYYTNTNTYEGVNGNRSSWTGKTNFMYNQKVWDEADDGTWEYTPLKYWPNDISTGDVDKNANPDEATGSVNGGKISFFAYAPYADAVGSDGITVLPGNDAAGDPILTYVIPTDGQLVDLLWGVYDGTDNNIFGTGTNTGVPSTASAPVNPDPEVTWPIPDVERNVSGGYAKDILRTYTMNADLTKQKTNGKVGFAFKHALAKVGGSAVGSGTQTGFQVALDIDDVTHTSAAKDPNTVVTIESISIKNNATKYYNASGLQSAAYIKGGTFNLATGKWTITEGTSSDAVTHTITRAGAAGSADLATSIAEPASVTTMTKPSTDYMVNGSVEGVTTTLKNVYQTETNPLVFVPGTIPSFDVTVKYLVRTFDGNLASSASGEGTWTKVTQTIKKSVTFTKPVQLNKQYNLVMYLGLTSVKFKASVSDWEQGDTDGDGDVDADDKTTVDLPLNVN